jgi:ribose transport system substrate-binding protein
MRTLVAVMSVMLIAGACSSGATATTAPVTAAPATAAPAPATAAPAPATAAPATAAPATAAPAANGAYTPLAAAPCDVSGKNIYFLSVLKGHPTLRLWQQGFLDQAKVLGFKSATIASPDTADWAASVALGEQIFATETAGDYGMVFGFVDPTQKDLIKKFGDASVPVVIGHVEVPADTYPGLKGWAAFDPVKWAASAADAIGEKIGGKGAVAITEGSFNAVEDAVAKGFADEMKAKFPDVKVLPPQEEGFDPPVSIAKAVAILQANPDVVGAVSTTGAGPVTWAGAADQTGRTVYSIGPDMTRPNLDAVRDGKVYGLAAQPGYEEHQLAVDMIAKLMCGGTVEYANELPAPIVLKDGLAPYYEVVDRIDARK